MADDPVPSSNAASNQPGNEADRLARELDEIHQRETSSRLKAAREFVRRRAEMETLRINLDQKDKDREALVVQLEAFTQRLAATEDERTSLAQKISRMQSSFSWKITQPWRALSRAFRPKQSGVMKHALSAQSEPTLVYYFYTTPFQIWKTAEVNLRGWVFSREGRRITAVRVILDDHIFPSIYGDEEPAVSRAHALPATNLPPGFHLKFPLPLGRHQLKVEALLDDHEWTTFFQAPIWRD